MEQKKLNNAAISAKLGSPDSCLEVIAGVYSLIREAVDSNWVYIDDCHKLEEYVYETLIWNAVRNYAPEKGDFKPYFRMRLRSTVARYRGRSQERLKRNGKVASLEGIAEKAAESGAEPFDIADDSTDVEKKVTAKESVMEKVALLAEGDPRKEMILTAWIMGYTNISELARLLADKRGTSESSERVFIQRYKDRCRTVLANAV